MANIVRPSNIKVTCLQAGADGFFEGPGDDTYARVTGKMFGNSPYQETDHSIKKANGQFAGESGMFSGETGVVQESGKLLNI